MPETANERPIDWDTALIIARTKLKKSGSQRLVESSTQSIKKTKTALERSEDMLKRSDEALNPPPDLS